MGASLSPEHTAPVPPECTTEGRRVDAGNVRVGDELLLCDGRTLTIPTGHLSPVSKPVYNLVVEELHCYAVGKGEVLVHNNSCLDDGWPIVSRIKESPKLVREAEASGKAAQESLDGLVKQLKRGNLNPGIGTKPIGMGISEARARDGARVYFRQLRDWTIEILGKSTKDNQEKVIAEGLRLFGGCGMEPKFEFHIVGSQTWDRHDDNIDVEIVVESSIRYSATFFTLKNIASLFAKYEMTGECASGTYLWGLNMILVRDLETETIRTAISDLLKTGEIKTACSRHEIM